MDKEKEIIGRIYGDKTLIALRRKINEGKGTFKDTADYSERAAELLGKYFSKDVLSLSAVERIAMNDSLLRDRYKDINELLDIVQTAADEAQGIHIRPQHAPYNEERADQIGRSLTDKTVSDEVIKRRAKSAPATAAKAMHDDYIKKNATFRNDAGLTCYIVREGSHCCPWCAEVAGKYRFGTQPDDIFRRHDNCDCTIIYDGQKLRGKQNADGSRSKTWEEVPDVPDYQPTVLSEAEARTVEQRNLAQFRGLTNGENGDRISGRGSGKDSTLSDKHFFEKIGEIDFNDKKAVASSLAEFESKYNSSGIEHCRVICKSGEVYEVHGDRYSVNTELLGDKMSGSINEHNHVKGESQFSFSWEDLYSSVKDGSLITMAYDNMYRYSMTFPNFQLSENIASDAYQAAKESVGNDLIFHPEKIPIGDEQHERITRACKQLGIIYRREKISK